MKHSSGLLIVFLGLHLACSVVGAQVSVLGSLRRSAVLNPGESGSGQIIVRNSSSTSEYRVRVYQTDYVATADGRTDYAKPGSLARSNVDWITFTPHQASIGPGATIAVDYEVRVPDHVNLPGTYWSMLMIEPESEPAAVPSEPGKIALHTVMRYAVHICTQVGDTGTCDMKFADKQVVSDEQGLFLQLDIENTGERMLILQVWADVYDSQGAKVAHIQGQQAGACPGCSTRVRLDLSSLKKGQYSVLVVADNGDEHVFGTRFRLDTR